MNSTRKPSDGDPLDNLLRRLLTDARTIAVAGLSANPDKDSHRVARYLQDHGYRIIPVNPTASEILGEKAYASLTDIPPDISIDIVDIFRKPEDAGPVAVEAVKRGAKAVWMQLGIVHEAAAEAVRKAGIPVVMDKCIKVEHARLVGG
jgi:uncharacterized protein